jgi:hypothetical protein
MDCVGNLNWFPAMQVSSWLDTQSKNGGSFTEDPIKGFASFHEAMEAR